MAQILRMASTEPGLGDDQWEEAQREAAMAGQLREPEGGSPPGGAEGAWEHVAVQVGAGGGLDAALDVLTPLPEGKRVSIRVSHVSAHVPLLPQHSSLLARLNPLALKRRISSVGTPRATHRQILFDVSASVEPGEVLALMGPSGSGKTSLLSIMGARAQKQMRSEGSVSFNGAPLTKRLKRRVGYVLQDDLLYESLTVHETLYYAAMLRLPRGMARDDKLRRVDVAITALGLAACRDTIIGGFFRKGISGGERKRASIGVELLIDPSVLMLDEPTSGLDSTTSMHVLRLLRHLATGGRAVVATIHQPSSRLYQQLDKLLLLSQGHAMYYGAAQQAGAWFEALGYALPWGTSLADFILDLASGDVALPGRGGEQSRLHLVERAERFLAAHQQHGFDVHKAGGGGGPEGGAFVELDAGGRDGRSGAPSDKDGVTAARAPARGSLGIAGHSSRLQPDHRWGAPYLTQVALLFRRSLRTRRFETLKDQDVAQFVAISLLAGLFWLQTGKDDTVLGARNTLGLLFFIAMFASFRSLFLALFTWPEEYKHMLKERASGMYRLSAFYAARTLSDVPMDLTLPTFFFIVVYWMGGLRADAGAFFGTYGTMLLTMLVAQGLGLLLGVVTMAPKTAQTLASVIMMGMVLAGGFFVAQLPAWLDWIKYLSFIYYSLGMMLFIQFDGGSRQLYSCTDPASPDACAQTNPGDPQADPACAPVDNIQQALGLAQNPASRDDAIRNALVLLSFFLCFRVLVYVVLRRKTARL